MAKLTRTGLKSIVKECLVEILAEGLASTGETLLESKTANVRKPKAKKAAPASFNNKRTLSENLLNKINSTTSDPILADILKDTAMNTLPNQVSADKNMSFVNRVSQGDQATKVMAESDPLDMFEGASNWETLAFSKPKNSNK
jgi:hypothetical protein